MTCPHCYLNLASAKNYLTESVPAKLCDKDFMAGVEEVVVVGKEPLANQRSIEIVTWLTENLSPTIKVSIITNGIGLPHLPHTTASHLKEVCLSLDGGPATYDRFRGEVVVGRKYTWSDVVASVASLSNVAPLTILHTVSSHTHDIDDMLLMEPLGPSKILFSPFVKTGDVTDQSLQVVPMAELLTLFAQSERFTRTPQASLVLGTHSTQGFSREELRELVLGHQLGRKVRWLGDSGRYVRLTHDGRVLTSPDALHMEAYVGAVDIADVRSLERFVAERR